MNPDFEAAKNQLLSVIADMFDVPCNEISQSDLTDLQDLINELQLIYAAEDNRAILCNM